MLLKKDRSKLEASLNSARSSSSFLVAVVAATVVSQAFQFKDL